MIFKQKVGKVYIYASSPVSKVVGEFEPVDVIHGEPEEVWLQTKAYAGVNKAFYDAYFDGRAVAYAIVIQNLGTGGQVPVSRIIGVSNNQ